MKKVLLLYTELAGYTLACLRALLQTDRVEVHLVRWPINKEAPFVFDFDSKLNIYERSDFAGDSLLKLAETIQPNCIICSGWIDKAYVKVARRWSKKIPVVLAMDNKWQGTLKQYFARLISPIKVLRNFNYAWVPGQAQYEYARRLGFKESSIRLGFYSADVSLFKKIYDANSIEKTKKLPHRFVYVGRYYEFKGIQDLWTAFIRLKSNIDCDWELWCAGTGDLVPIQHDAIRHLGFIQPNQLKQLMLETSVFVMPSRVEPWGVVLHEFAAAGFPLISSDKVGASSRFVNDGFNGYIYPSANTEILYKKMLDIVRTPDKDLIEMGAKSVDLAQTITPDLWAKTLIEFTNLKSRF